MDKVCYPAIFHSAEDKGYWVTFPDFEYVLTQGDTIEDTYDMCIDALGLALTTLDKNEKRPSPTAATNIKLSKQDQIVLVHLDLDEYKRKNNNKPVKKTLSIPCWLNEEAIAKGLNFSAILQKALKEELNIL